MSNDHLKPAPEAWWRTHMAATQIRRLLGDNGLDFSQGALLALGEPDLVCENPHGPNRPSMRLWLIERVYGRLASLKTPVPDPIPAQPEEVSLAAAWTRIRQARALRRKARKTKRAILREEAEAELDVHLADSGLLN